MLDLNDKKLPSYVSHYVYDPVCMIGALEAISYWWTRVGDVSAPTYSSAHVNSKAVTQETASG